MEVQQNKAMQLKQEQDKRAAYLADYERKQTAIKQQIDRIRFEHQDLFNAFTTSMLPQAIAKREATLMNRINDIAFTQTLGVSIKHDWVFNAHRSVWQKYILDHYIRLDVIAKLDEGVVATALVREFGVLDFISQIDHLSTITFRDEHIQILNKDEQSYMPTGVVSFYFQELINKDIIRHAPGYQYALGKNAYPDQQQEPPNYQSVFAEYQDVYFVNNESSEHTRAERIKESMRRIYFDYQGAGRICDTCFMFSAIQDGPSCPFCGGELLRDIVINKTKLHMLEARINQDSTSVKLSINYIQSLNNMNLLIDWEM